MERIKKLLDRSLFQLYGWMIVLELILISLAINFYNGNFLLWQYPLSTSGVAFTFVEGNANVFSMYLFAFAMIVGAVGMKLSAMKLYFEPKTIHRNLKFGLNAIGAAGFFITAFSPDDIRHPGHVIGLALAVTSIWLIAFVHLAEIRRKVARRAFFAAELLLNLPLFIYAQAYFIRFDPASYSFQKIALFAVCIVLLWSTNISDSSLPLSEKRLE